MKKWKCTVCDYVAEGLEPPETCPVCGVSREFFVEISEATTGVQPSAIPVSSQTQKAVLAGGKPQEALFKISYGLYVVSSTKDGRINGQTCNTVFQVTSQPARVAVGINKQNLTHDYIRASGVMAISVLGEDQIDLAKHFGFQSGRKVDKYASQEFSLSGVGCPVVLKSAAYFDCKVVSDYSLDLGSHTLFVADVLNGDVLAENYALTYDYYRKHRG